jgi:hypothetical protein
MTVGGEPVTVPLNAEQWQKFKDQDADGTELAKGME